MNPDDDILLAATQTTLNTTAEQRLKAFRKHIEASATGDNKIKTLSPLTHTRLNRALLFSQYLRTRIQHQPNLLNELLTDDFTDNPLPENYFTEQLSAISAKGQDTASALRKLRQRFMCRLIYRHFNRLGSLEELTGDLSDLADHCLLFAMNHHYNQLVKRFGYPIGEYSRAKQTLTILSMGKLGARELNLSSDIDLVFTYREGGETDGRESIPNQQFFTLLGREIINTLNTTTADGLVFRVDMRLRPYGQSGQLVSNFKALEHYYQKEGREWERFALIKGRPLPFQPDGEALSNILSPFVYRRYTDFSAIEALKDMKALINREVRRQGKDEDIKLGRGGIREIEFIAQAFQLIHGGKRPALQERNLKTVLRLLARFDLLPAHQVDALINAYDFLRHTEHCLQGTNDEQTHRLPTDKTDRHLLALAMGFDHYPDFDAALSGHRQTVRDCFDRLIRPEPDQQQDSPPPAFKIERESTRNLEHWLQTQHFNEDERQAVSRFISSAKVRSLLPLEWERLSTCLQVLLPRLAAIVDRKQAVPLIIALLRAIIHRSVYLVLLNENSQALTRLTVMATDSPWIMEQLRQYPALLDELLETKPLGHFSSLRKMSQSLRETMLRIPEDDTEAQMDSLRYFKMATQIRIVHAEITGQLSLFSISDYLSHLAETLIDYCLSLAFQDLTERYGRPTANGIPFDTPPFAVIAYGKLGGLELSHDSDLDLVFLFDAPIQEMTDGENRIQNAQFFTRLGQRIIHLLSAGTAMGRLYDIDMRLRPSGNKGLLVSSLTSFTTYQQKSAWTWEQQALVRARIVAGDARISDNFEQLRRSILTKPRETGPLAEEVTAMREKMWQHLAPPNTKSKKTALFHLKHGRWGIVDIEFMVQFAVLAYANQFEALSAFTDNIRLLEVMADHRLITETERKALVDAYSHYRSSIHRQALRLISDKTVKAGQFENERLAVKNAWQKLIGSAIKKG